MIGRSNELSSNLTYLEQICGEYTGKERVIIFDYYGNFEYFRVALNGFESSEAKSLSEGILGIEKPLTSIFEN